MFNWTHYDIVNGTDVDNMYALWKGNQEFVFASALDTETTGLNHIHDKPFLFQFGWVTGDKLGFTFVVDIEQNPELARRTISLWNILVRDSPWYVGHNVKFDLHMCTNIGLPYTGTNVTDNQCWIRLGTDAIPERKGGAPMALKPFAKRYVNPKAKEMDTLLQKERQEIASELNLKLKRRLSWTKKQIEDFFKDKTNEVEDLPTDKQTAYKDWLLLDVPLYLQGKIRGAVDSDDIPYNVLNRKNVIHYGHLDIVWTLESFCKLEPVVRARGNFEGILRENANIPVLFDMERIGFKIDYPYLCKARKDLKEYIRRRRKDLCDIAMREIRVSQTAQIKEVLDEMGVRVISTGAEELSRICSDLKRDGTNDTAVLFIEAVQELRTLEKWYSTYIMRFIANYKEADGKLYTQIHQSGTVSGRVTSDFQQFPKDGIVTVDGIEIFNPRRMVLAQDGDYIGIVYLDYSQIELRLQAMYTILVGHPDINLCRTYSPYGCHTFIGDEVHQQKKMYDCHDKWCIQHAYDYVWYYNEDPEKKWTALDVHGATTKIAFQIEEDNQEFHHLRYKGKRVNFAKNYGAQYSKIREMFPEYDEETCHRIDDAYYIAFPGVKEYHNYCYNMARINAYMQNLFGVRYYGASGHNLINMLVQGTGAYFLKEKKVQVAEYLKTHNCYSKLMMEIHDELQFKWHRYDDPQIFFDIKQIMETWDDTLIPIVADMELTKTTWADKVEITRKEQFHEVQVHART